MRTALVLIALSLLAQNVTAQTTDGSLYFEVSYPNSGPFDFATGTENCRLVQVADTGTVGTVRYAWDWGDGVNETTNQSVARHWYSPGAYTILVTTYNRTSATSTYFLDVYTAGTGCSYIVLAKYAALPMLVASIGYASVGLMLSMQKKEERRRLWRWFLLVSVLLFIGFVAVTSFLAGHVWPFTR